MEHSDLPAPVVELVYTAAWGAVPDVGMRVRVPLGAPNHKKISNVKIQMPKTDNKVIIANGVKQSQGVAMPFGLAMTFFEFV